MKPSQRIALQKAKEVLQSIDSSTFLSQYDSLLSNVGPTIKEYKNYLLGNYCVYGSPSYIHYYSALNYGVEDIWYVIQRAEKACYSAANDDTYALAA